MSKHTPAPWALTETVHENIVSSWDVKIGDHEVNVFPYKRIFSEDRTQSGLVIDPQIMADARLIAASPDLLEALKAIVALEKTPDDVWDAVEVVMPKMCEIANAAIAKAEGKA